MITKFKIFELVDYNQIDYEQDTYNGNLYLYSDEPLELEDIDFDNLDHLKQIYLTNRADASDINSEYIYQIKTKKPFKYKINRKD